MTDDRGLDPSLKLLLDALERSPDNAPLRMHVASVFEKAKRHADALEHYRRCEGDAAVGHEALVAAARCALALGDVDAAIGKADEALGLVPGFAPALLARARARHTKNLHREALTDYDQAVARAPELADPSLRDALLRDVTDPRARLRVVTGGAGGANGEATTAGAATAASGGANAGPEGGGRDRVTFAEVGGLDALKEKLRMRIVYPFANPELFKTFNKRVGGGILFYGPPGCGKTFLARATAGECRAHFVSVGLHEVLDMWLGNSERQLHALFDDARRRAPSVLFFDEVDALGIQRARLSSGSMRGVITQFLAELDGFASKNERVLVIGATNTPWDIDPAFRRPGRFDQVLFVPPPDRAARVQILRLKAEGRPLADDVDFDALAAQLEGWSGADLEHVVETAAEYAITQSISRGTVVPIGRAHLEQARAKVRPTTREWFTSARNYAQYANEAGQYDDIADYMAKHGLR